MFRILFMFFITGLQVFTLSVKTCMRPAINRQRSSNNKQFLAFQIFQVRKRGRYRKAPSLETQLDRFSMKVGAFQRKCTLNILLRPNIRFFKNRQPTKTWSTDSTSSLQRQHLLGPYHPFLHIISQVLIFFLHVSQIKHLSLWGILKCQIFNMISFSMIDL